jgi:hypothetical protein
MKRLLTKTLWLLVPLALASCEDEQPPVTPPVDSLSACLTQPGELQRAPSGQLPCELLPPGFSR